MQTPIRTAVFSRRGAEARRSLGCAMRRDASAFPPCGSSRISTVPIPISIHFSQRTQRAQRSLGDSPGGSICVHLRHLRLKIRNFHGMESVFSNRRNRTQGVAEACRSLRSSRAWREAMAWKFRIVLGGWSNLIHPRHKGVGVWEDGRLAQESQRAQKERKRRSEQPFSRAEARRSLGCAMRWDASAFPPRGSSRFSTVPIPISIHFSQRTQRAQRSLDDSPGGSICVHLRHPKAMGSALNL
jgi:hypothetical protein